MIKQMFVIFFIMAYSLVGQEIDTTTAKHIQMLELQVDSLIKKNTYHGQRITANKTKYGGR